MTNPTGNWSACNYARVALRDEFGGGGTLGAIGWNTSSWGSFSLPAGGMTTTVPTSLLVDANCGMGNPGDVVPSFDMTITLALTKRNTTATGTFN